MILTPLQKVPNNVGNLGKIIVATGFEWLPKVQKIAQSGHTVCFALSLSHSLLEDFVTVHGTISCEWVREGKSVREGEGESAIEKEKERGNGGKSGLR